MSIVLAQANKKMKQDRNVNERQSRLQGKMS